MNTTQKYKRKYASSSLLNLPGHHSTAAIGTKILSQGHSISGDLFISDCSRTINLDLYSDNPEELENVIHKVNTIILELRKLLSFLDEIAKDYYLKYPKFLEFLNPDSVLYEKGCAYVFSNFFKCLIRYEENNLTREELEQEYKELKSFLKTKKVDENILKEIKELIKLYFKIEFNDKILEENETESNSSK